MSLADACLVRLSERYPDCQLFTLDTDFEHYRRNGRQIIPLLHPAYQIRSVVPEKASQPLMPARLWNTRLTAAIRIWKPCVSSSG